jgi:hypothetical protein
MVVAVLALVGLFISLYLLAYSVGLIPLLCGVGSCETVQASEWAKVGPIPVPLLGVGGYLSLLGVTLLGCSRATSRRAGRPRHAGARDDRRGLLRVSPTSRPRDQRLVHVVHHLGDPQTLIFLASLPELRRGAAA